MSDQGKGGVLPVPRRAGIDCSEAIELIPVMALGAIEPAERILLQAHVERCVHCSIELASSSNAATMLAYTVPLFTPPARAKTALFDRIALDAPVVVEPKIVSAELPAVPLVSSPGEKRRRHAGEAATITEERFAPGSVSSPFSRLTVRFTKLAVAPLALALVLVSVYAMQTRNDVHDLQATNASLISASRNAASDTSGETELANAPVVESTITAANASNFTIQPVVYTFSAAGNGGQTESARSISPIDSTCKMAGDGSGNYHLQISGVELAGDSDVAAIYLQAQNGTRTFLTNVTLDKTGSGEARFSFNEAISEYSMLLIGPQSSGSAGAQPLDGATTYLLTNDDSGVAGLGASS